MCIWTVALQPKPVTIVSAQDDWFATPAEPAVSTNDEMLIEKPAPPAIHMPLTSDISVSPPIQPTTHPAMFTNMAPAQEPASKDTSTSLENTADSMPHASASKPIPSHDGQLGKPPQKISSRDASVLPKDIAVSMPPHASTSKLAPDHQGQTSKPVEKTTATAARTTSSVTKDSPASEASSSKVREQQPAIPTIQTARSLIPASTSSRNVAPIAKSNLPQTKPALSTEFITALALNNGNARSGAAGTKKFEKNKARRLKKEARRATAQSTTDVPSITPPPIDLQDSPESLGREGVIATSTSPSSAYVQSRSGSDYAAVAAILQVDAAQVSPLRESTAVVPSVEEDAGTVVKHVASTTTTVVETPPEPVTITHTYMNMVCFDSA